MAKVSVIIPARNEQFLPQTVNDIFEKAVGDVEVVVHLDGYWPDPLLEDRDNLTLIHRSKSHGMRAGINAAAAVATGKYLMKCDAHCMFVEGFDELLQAECDDDWVMIPRRYSLNAETWDINRDRPAYDYHFLSCPFTNADQFSMHGKWWRERGQTRADVVIDDEMTTQGSCWFMSRRHFWMLLGGLDARGYGQFRQEPQEITMKTWLGGGRVVVNKKVWYAHLHKGKRYGRGYFMSKSEVRRGNDFSANYWMHNRWSKRVHDFEWLIDKFWPVPTWPEDWKERELPPYEYDV